MKAADVIVPSSYISFLRLTLHGVMVLMELTHTMKSLRGLQRRLRLDVQDVLELSLLPIYGNVCGERAPIGYTITFCSREHFVFLAVGVPG